MNECKFSVELWVGLQNSEEKIACSEKTGESRTINTEEKRRHFWKKIVGGHQITPGTNFQHMFRKFLPDPPLLNLADFVI